MDLGKIPPYSIEAEKSVLGAMLIDESVIDDVSEIIKSKDFFKEEHSEIYTSMQELHSNKKPVDLITVGEFLRAKGTLLQVGGYEYLTMLGNDVPTSANVKYYANIVNEKSTLRKLIKLSKSIENLAFDGYEEATTIIQKTVDFVSSIQSDSVDTEVAFVPDLLEKVMAEIDENNRRGTMAGTPTGFKILDAILAGWQRQRFYVLGARPKMGKTSFFCQLADKASETFPVIIFSLEMSKEMLIKMLLFQRSKVDSMSEQKGELVPEDFECLCQSYVDMYNNMLFIDDKSRTVAEMKATIRKVKKELTKMGKEPWIGLIVIDYLQLIQGDKRLKRNYQLEEISREFMNMKKELDTTILALSQLDRKVDERQDPRPLPSDLRDTGAFEQDCDGLMLMYRDAYYHERTNKNSKIHLINGKEVSADIVEVNMFLNRFGPAGIMKFEMFLSYRLFAEPKEGDVIVDVPKSTKAKSGKSRVVQTRFC